MYPNEAEEDQGEVVECDGEDPESEEVQASKIAPSPSLPSAAEVEDHRISHLPFRSWCKECILGKALGEQRCSRGHSPSKIAVIGIDYFYMTEKGLLTRSELAEKFPMTSDGDAALCEARNRGEAVKCLIVRCSATKLIFAHVVPVKGLGEDAYVCELVASDVQWMGHTRLIVKADNEPALQTVVVETIKRLRIKVEDLDSISKEQPERYESQSNGLIEVGVRNLRAQFRTMRACLEARVGKGIPVMHPIAAWLIEHCCLLLNGLRVGDDGFA